MMRLASSARSEMVGIAGSNSRYSKGSFSWSGSGVILLYRPSTQLAKSEQYHFENRRSEGPPARLENDSSLAKSVTILNEGMKVVSLPALR